MGVPPPTYEQQPNAPLPEPSYHQPTGTPQQSFAQPSHQGSFSPAAQSPYSQPAQPAPIQHQASYHQPQQQQQPAYHQAPQQQTVMATPAPIPLASLQKFPAWVQCPSCTSVQMTRADFVTGTATHLWALGFCCCLCLGCIPYCVSSFKDVEHHCGHCGILLAVHKRSSGTQVVALGGPPQQQHVQEQMSAPVKQ